MVWVCDAVADKQKNTSISPKGTLVIIFFLKEYGNFVLMGGLTENTMITFFFLHFT